MDFPRYAYKHKANSPWQYRGVGYVVVPVDDEDAFIGEISDVL